MKIWIDADACPKMIKDIIFKASIRLQIPLSLVANSYMAIPRESFISFVQVEKGADVADFYIVKNIKENDLVITADIPLAAQVVAKKAVAINPRGEIYTEENVGEKLSVRDFAQGLRNCGVITGGPAPLGKKDKERFASSFNQLVTKMLK